MEIYLMFRKMNLSDFSHHFIPQSIYGYVIILIIILLIYIWRKLTFWKRNGIVQNIGHMRSILKMPLQYADYELIQKYGKIVGTYELLNPVLIIADPEIAYEICVNRFKDFSNHRLWTTEDNHMGKSLLSLNCDKWKPQRAMISHFFTAENIKRIEQHFYGATKLLMKNMKMQMNKENVNIVPFIEAYATDVLLRTCFATEFESINDPNNIIVKNLRNSFGSDFTLSQLIAFMSPKLGNIFGFSALKNDGINFLTEIFLMMVNERKHKIGNVKRYLIQLLIEAKNYKNYDSTEKICLSEKEIIDNCLLFLLVGYAKTFTTLSHLIYCLAINPHVQENLIKEIEVTIWKSKPDIDTVNKMKYLDACINETLRLFPSVNRIERVNPHDITFLNVFMPKGTYFVISPYSIHRDPNNFENPNDFIPERFFPENRRNIKPGTFLPFADGPRNCIGMRFTLTHIKLCICSLLKHFRFEECNKTSTPQYYNVQPVTKPKSIFIKVCKKEKIFN